MQRGYFQKRSLGLSQDDYRKRDTAIGSRRRTKRKPPKPDEIVQMLFEALIEKHPYSFISKKHSVGVKTISVYVSRAKRNPRFMKEPYSKENMDALHSSEASACIG